VRYRPGPPKRGAGKPGLAARTGAPAEHFSAGAGELGPADAQLALDLETSDGQPADRVVDWVLAFLDAAEARLGMRFIIHTGGYRDGWLDTFARSRAK